MNLILANQKEIAELADLQQRLARKRAHLEMLEQNEENKPIEPSLITRSANV
jgi:hypothetical protein